MFIDTALKSIFGVIVLSAIAAEVGVTAESGPAMLEQAIVITRTYVEAIIRAMA
jgi:hypothetical protein